jgi:hypothetical protein
MSEETSLKFGSRGRGVRRDRLEHRAEVRDAPFVFRDIGDSVGGTGIDNPLNLGLSLFAWVERMHKVVK